MENLKLNTPTGIASYPHLTTPDEYMGSKAYKTKLLINASEEDFRAKVDAFIAKSKEEALSKATEALEALDPEAKSPKAQKAYKSAFDLVETIKNEYRSPIEDEYNDQDEPTGRYILTTKSKDGFTDRKTGEFISLAPKFYDAAAQPMADRPLIKGGSKLNLMITLVAYAAGAGIGAGVTCRINAVQIIKLSGGGSGGGEGGFSAQEGYSAEPAFSPAASNDNEDDVY